MVKISVYLISNDRIDAFQSKLDGLEVTIIDIQRDLIVVGDFNAKTLEWGRVRPFSRRKRLMDMVSRLGLVVLNRGSTSTFKRRGYKETMPDY